jgi:signal transduction histidine kinase
VKRKDLLLFFVLPFAAVLVLFFVLSALNRSFIQRKTESLVRDQLRASAQILQAGVKDALDEGKPPAGLLGRYAGEESIHFLALLDDRGEVLDWKSRFEGYLPVSRRSAPAEDSEIIDSPAGRILVVHTSFRGASGTSYHLHLGYSLESLESMLARSRGNFLLVFAAMAAAGFALFRGVYLLHRHSVIRAKEAEAERQEKERFKSISGFTAGVAHEIKNPLNSLSLLFELLSRKAPAEVAEDIALGKGEVERIARTIDRFSETIRPLALRKETVLLAPLIDMVRSAFEKESGSKGVLIRTEVDPPALSASLDRDLLTQALANLVRNALEATESGEIRVSAAGRKRAVVIRVEDRGTGIAPEDLDRVFEPFHSSKPSGLGVGLFLVRNIVQSHGGTVAAAARPGGGSVFTIELPGGPS